MRLIPNPSIAGPASHAKFLERVAVGLIVDGATSRGVRGSGSAVVVGNGVGDDDAVVGDVLPGGDVEAEARVVALRRMLPVQGLLGRVRVRVRARPALRRAFRRRVRRCVRDGDF